MVDVAMHSVQNTGDQSSEEYERNQVDVPRQKKCDVLVMNAISRQSLTAVRSLGKHGLQVTALESSDFQHIPAFSSRWCHEGIICPPYQETQAYVDSLHHLLESREARVVIPTSDGDVALLRQYREQCGAHHGLAIAKEPALAIAVSKEQTLAAAKRLGLRIPRGIVLKHVSEVGEALQEIGLPAVVKPEESWIEDGQRGVRVACYLVTTPDEARQAVEALTCFGGKVLFQHYLTGRREAVSFLYARGQVYARFAQWARRTWPPLGGTSILRQSIVLPDDIGEQAENLIREIELEGYSEVEFRRDSAGYPYLMEINPRLSASLEIAIRSGVDFPYLLYQWASGERIDTIEGYRSGLWMRYLGGDIATMIEALRQRGRPGVSSPARTLLDFCSSFFVPMRYDSLDWTDPLPTWTTLIGAHHNIWKRIQKHFFKSNIS